MTDPPPLSAVFRRFLHCNVLPHSFPAHSRSPWYLTYAHSHLFKIPYHSPHLQSVQSWFPSAWGNGSKLNRRSGSLLFRRKCTIFTRRLHLSVGELVHSQYKNYHCLFISHGIILQTSWILRSLERCAMSMLSNLDFSAITFSFHPFLHHFRSAWSPVSSFAFSPFPIWI